METFSFALIFGVVIMHLCQGVTIDVMETDSSDCLHPPVQIVCTSTAAELQAANNEISITRNGLTLARCKDGVCTTVSKRYNATVVGARAILTVQNMDVFYDNNAWACTVGIQTALLRLKYLRAKQDDFHTQFIRGINIVDLLTLLFVIIILIVVILQMFCRNCCRRNSEKDPECCSCFGDLICCRQQKTEEVKTGYTGKKWDVKTSYVIDDPNHVPDAKFKDGSNRKAEAERACKNVSDKDKEVIAEKLTEWTEVRKPLVSTSNEDGAEDA